MSLVYHGSILLYSALGPNFFVAQQYRLLSMAHEHVNVILALNYSVIYLGIAGGAALGGGALHYVPLAQLGWVAAGCTLLSLLLLFLSIRVSKRTGCLVA